MFRWRLDQAGKACVEHDTSQRADELEINSTFCSDESSTFTVDVDVDVSVDGSA